MSLVLAKQPELFAAALMCSSQWDSCSAIFWIGNNMAYFINCKNVATKMGIEKSKAPDFVFTNFIR